MANPLTSLSLMGLTVLAAVAAAVAVRRLRADRAGVVQGGEVSGDRSQATGLNGGERWGVLEMQNGLVGLCVAGAAVVVVWRWGVRGWGGLPIGAHVDGLLVLAVLLGGSVLYLQTRARMGGLAAFGLPILAFVLLWAVCASAWTYHPFALDTLGGVWRAVHLVGVYGGTLGAVGAAGAGAMYLYVQQRLKDRSPGALRGVRGLASLESLETLIVRASGLGFVLLTLGLVTGVLVIYESDRVLAVLGDPWWGSPKVWLAVGAWAVYAVLMNVRLTGELRGRRAAWLAIGGLVLLLGVYGLVTAWPAPEERGYGVFDVGCGMCDVRCDQTESVGRVVKGVG
ncbi:MAG: cytochrome c biogenesis protein CcsA [Planctomycetota bacterium]